MHWDRPSIARQLQDQVSELEVESGSTETLVVLDEDWDADGLVSNDNTPLKISFFELFKVA